MWAFDLVQSTAMLKLSLYLFVVWFCICLFFGFVFVLYFLAGCALVLSAAVVLVSLASWRRRRGLTFAADPQIRTTGSTLHSAAQPKKNCPPSFFCQKLASDIFWAMASVSKADYSTSISGVSDYWCDQKSRDINVSARFPSNYTDMECLNVHFHRIIYPLK